MTAVSNFLGADDFLQECANPAPDILILACTIGDDDGNPQSRLILVSKDACLDFTVSGLAFVSVDASPDGRAFVLGESGSVIQFDWRALDQKQLKASRKVLHNDRADTFGPLRRVRIIGESVFTVGTAGQIYRLEGSNFEPLPQLVFNNKELSAKDVSGTSYNDLVVVTTEGDVAQFDGEHWHVQDLPTSAGLNSICRLADGRYAVAGYNSTLLIGVQNKWQVWPSFEDARNYYGVATPDGENVFVSYLGGIDKVDGGALTQVITQKSSPKSEFAFLRSGPDGVWAASGQTIGRLTPAGWISLV